MNLAVKLYGENVLGIPAGYPSSVRPLGETTGPLLPGETVMNHENYTAYVESQKAEYDKWYESFTFKTEAEARIRFEAQKRIVENLMGMPLEDFLRWLPKQLNMVSSAVVLMLRRIQRIELDTRTPVPAEEDAAMAQLFSVWAKVDQVRQHSNLLEAQVQAGQKPDVKDGWPV